MSDGRSNQKVLLGVDIGATSIKAGAFTEQGRELVVVHRPNAPIAQPDFAGGIIWNLARMRRQAFDALREVVSRLDGAEPISIGVTAFGADGAPMSPAGKQLYPAISWHEPRAKPQCARIIDELTPATIYRITGYHLAPMATVCKWAWLQENRPDVLEGATWLMIPDQMVYWLTGEMRTDPMNASCEVAIDLRTGGWAEEMIRAARINQSLLAPLTRPGEVAGRVRPEIADSLGLPRGLPVAIGGHDVEVGAMAVGTGRPGHRYLDVAGTWEILLAHTTEFCPENVLYERGIDWAPYVNEGEFLAFSNMPAGSVLNWVRSVAFQRASWETVAREAEQAGVGANGIRFFPSLIEGMGPYGLQNLPGSLIGIRTLTKRGELIRSAIEALCIQVGNQLKLLEEMTGQPCEVLRVVGGGHKNDLWLQTKANVLGRPVEIVDISEATLLGAALLGGVGAGFYPSIPEAQDAVRFNIQTIEPDMPCHDEYLSIVESYNRIPSALAPLSRH
jgi:L-fuculokinase